MSDLLNQASLVMVPSGYKEDTVYSVVPSDGSGDMAFTRASNGTRINSAGLVEVCPWNLLEQSETFDNGVWAKESGNSVTANTTTAPNGTTTADTLSATATNTINTYQVYAITAGVYTYSVYVKKKSTNIISTYIYQTGVGFAAIGEINFDNETFTNGTIESVGNGWFRVALSATLTTQTHTFGFYTSSTTGTRDVYIWGAQLNIGSTAKPYFPTTDRLNVPRLTYQNGGGGCPSLLLEPQRTNLLIYSEQFDQWSTSGTTTTNVAISPDGTQNADRLNYTSGNIYWLDASVNVTNGVVYTYSLYVKPTSVGNQFRFYLDGTFNVSTVITTDSSDWKRYTWTFTASATGSINPHILLGYGYSSQSILAWGAQLEASSYPTSYIPTTSSSATRVADDCRKTGISSLIGQTEGVVFIDINRNYITSSYDRYFAVDDTYASIYRTGIFILPEPTIDGRVYVELRNNNTGVFGYTYNSTTIPRLKIAVAYKNNDMAIYINGTQMATSSASLTFAHTLSGVLSSGNGQSINEAVIFPTRLTNTELASLTTI